MNSKKLLLVFFILLILAVSIMIMLYQIMHNPKKTRDYPEIKESGVLNIVTDYNLSDYYVSGDTIAGFQYELSKYIANQSGLEINMSWENDLEKCITGLQNKTFDIIARNIPITNENKTVLAFTNPIARNKQVLIQQKKTDETDNFIENHLQLANKKLYVPKGSPNVLRLKNLSEEIAEPIFIEEIEDYSDEQLMSMVSYGEIDYAVVDKKIALSYRSAFPNIDMNTEISFTQLQAWAVRKDSPILLDSLNVWLSK